MMTRCKRELFDTAQVFTSPREVHRRENTVHHQEKPKVVVLTRKNANDSSNYSAIDGS